MMQCYTAKLCRLQGFIWHVQNSYFAGHSSFGRGYTPKMRGNPLVIRLNFSINREDFDLQKGKSGAKSRLRLT